MKAAGGGDTLRLFVAGDLPDEMRRAVEAWQCRAFVGREGLRLNHALHITLAFLGSVAAVRVPELTEALSQVRVRPCRVKVTEPVFLPVRGAKRVVALQLESRDGELTRLQADVADALAGTGLFKAQARPWLPHLTVARYRRPGHPFSLQNVNIPGSCVVRVVLYSSLLERAGAVHTPLATFSAS
ncbi:MAG: RNA 2',3'-cyclic phosphodiesterase [Actinobacteria bacterium]|nr:RNA 2',3'-cyclic phosphodiesterase [Actinomycetota bacterium]